MAERWVSIDEISEHLGVKKDTIYKWVAKKRSPPTKLAGSSSFKSKK